MNGAPGTMGLPGMMGEPGDAGPQGPAGPVTAQLQAVFPDSIAKGRRTSVVVIAVGTAFDSTTTVSAGSDVTVHSITVISPAALRVEVTASGTAAVGPRTLTVTTGSQVLTLINGLNVILGTRATVVAGGISQGSPFLARLEVMSGKQFTQLMNGDLDNAKVTGTGVVVKSARFVGPTTVDVFGVVVPSATVGTGPLLTLTFDDTSTEAVALPAVTATTPSNLPTTSVSTTTGTTGSAVYSIDIATAPVRLGVTVTPTGAMWPIGVLFFDNAGALLQSNSLNEVVLSTNGHYFVVVGDNARVNRNATFTIASALRPVSANGVCSGAIALTTPLTGQTFDQGGTSPSVCTSAAPQAKYFSIAVPAANAATVTMTTTGGNAGLSAIDSCGATTCLAETSGFGTQTLTLTNGSAAVKTFIVSANNLAPGSATFSLGATIVPLAGNAACATPTALTPGTPITSQAIGAGGAPLAACQPTSGPGEARARFYSVSIAAGSQLRASVSGAGFTPTLSAVDSCTATTCTRASGAGTALLLRNSSTSAVNTVLSVGGTGSATGAFGISATATPIAANAVCSAPTAITVGTPVTGENINGGGAPLTACARSTTRPELALARFYSVVVPANTLVNFSVTGVGMDPALAALDTCADTTCNAFSDVFGPTESLALRNEGTSARTFIVSVSDEAGNNTTGTYGITTTSTSLAAGCAAPTTLTVGTPLTGEVINIGSATATQCLPLSDGPVRYYSLSVAANEAVRVAVSASAGPVADPSLRVLDTCAATTCLASSDGIGLNDSLVVTNSSSSARTYLIVVGSRAGAAFTFSLSATRAAFVVSTPPTACTVMTSGTDVTWTQGNGVPNIGDDVATSSVPLPFTIPFFGQSTTHYSVSTNGLMTLSVGAGNPAPTNSYGAPIPDSFAPNNVIAPLWDDMVGVVGTATVKTLVTGSMPNRVFTVEWANMAPYSAGQPSNAGPQRISFQVHLVETTGVIEFHYCSAAANGGTSGFETGATASIGVEDATGSAASVNLGNNQANAASLTTAYRLTPQ